MSTVLFVTSRFPYPIERGDKLRAYHQIRSLSPHAKVVLVAIVEGDVPSEDLSELEPYCERIHLVHKSRLQSIPSVLTAVLRGLPMQVGYFRTRSVMDQIARIVRSESPDRIYCQLIRTAWAAPGSGVPSTIDYQDSMSAAASRRAELAKAPLKQFWKLEAKRLAHYEQESFAWFQNRIIISSQDRRTFEFPEARSMDVLGNGVDSEFFDPEALSAASAAAGTSGNLTEAAELIRGGRFAIGFIGNLGYPPNISAVDVLVKEVLPVIRTGMPDANCLLAGARPARPVLHLGSDHVSVVGWVDDIRTAYASTDVMVAPLFMGAGQQNKVLEAMAMGIPVVTTDLVNNAIGAKDGREILLAGSAGEFAAQTLRLLQDEDLYSRVSAEGLKFVRENFSWQAVGRQLASILGVRPSMNDSGDRLVRNETMDNGKKDDGKMQ